MSRRNWHRWIANLHSQAQGRRSRRATRAARNPQRGFSPAIETLERRVLLSSLPVVTTTTVSSVAAGAAIINGTVNPEGATVGVSFQYSTEATFTPNVETTLGSGFNNPTGVAVDASDDVFIADLSNNAVKEVLPGGTIKTIGSGFNAPTGVAVDAAGDVFVADQDNNAVKEVLAGSGAIQTIGSGFLDPDGVAVDASGDVLVADGGHNAVKEVLAGSGAIQTIGSGFVDPIGVAVDTSGDVFVADTGNRAVKEILPDGSIQTIGSGFSAPAGVAVDASGDVFVADQLNNAVTEILSNGTTKTLGSGFSGPTGVVVGPFGDVFVADQGNNRVVELSPPTVAATPSSVSGSTATAVSGTLVGLAPATTYYYRVVASSAADTTLSTAASFTTILPVALTAPASSVSAVGATLNGSVNPEGATVGVSFQYSTDPTFTPSVETTIGSGFNAPDGVAVDASGDVFVTDAMNDAVKEVLPNGTIKTIGSGFSFPHGVAVDSSGDVFVADYDNNAVKEVLAGSGEIETIGSGFGFPAGVAVDAAGDVFVADAGNSVVKEVLPDGTIKTITGITNAAGIPDGLAVDASGDVFVADAGNSVVKEVLPNGAIKTIGSGFFDPTGVAVDSSGDVYVADFRGNAVKEVLADSGAIESVGSGFNNPDVVVVGSSGDVFVADMGNSRVVGLSTPTVAATASPLSGSTATLVSATVAGLTPGATYYYRVRTSIGAANESTSSPASFTTLLPTAATLPASSVSAVGATLNGSVNPEGATVGVSFEFSTGPTFKPSVETTIGSGFSTPAGVAVDALGDVFVADNVNEAVKEILPGGSIKTLGFGFNTPLGVAVDASGDVFVADDDNRAVKEILAGSGAIKTIGSGFSLPDGVAVDASGDVFVADIENHAVEEVLAGSGAIQTIASGFTWPAGVAVDAAGDVFVADQQNNAVMEVLAGSGAIKTIGSGFDRPTGVAVDAAGDVFVADQDNNAVKEVLTDGTIQAIGFGFSGPTGVAVDSFGDVFVADLGHNRVVELSPPAVAATPSPLSGSTATAVSGTLLGLTPGTTYYYRAAVSSAGGIIHSPPQSFTTLTLPAVATSAASSVSATGATLNGSVNPEGSTATARFQYSTDPTFPPSVETTIGPVFNHPTGVAMDASGDVFVADFGNSAVKETLPDGTIKTIGSGFSGSAGVAVDAAGDVFVADFFNSAVKEVMPGGTIRTIGSAFHNPAGVAVDASGDVFVADNGNNALKEVLPNGNIKTIGSGFRYPTGVAVDASGDVFVADSGNNALEEVLPDGTIKTIGSGFTLPEGVAADASGDVFVADNGNNAVKEVLTDGTIKTIGSGFSQPSGVAVDSFGDVFIADSENNRVVELSRPAVAATPSPLSGSTATAVSGTLLGLTPGTTYYYRAVAFSPGIAVINSPPQSFTTLTPPTVATDPASSISAVGATLNGSVNPEGATVAVSFQYSTDPTFPLSVETTIGSGFSYPNGVAVDASGDVFVADQSNSAVKEVLTNGTTRTIGSGFVAPSGVALDAAGDVFVADTANNAVEEVLPSGTIKTIGSGFTLPLGVAVDSVGDVFVADTANNAVKEVLPSGTIQTIGSGFSHPSSMAVDSSGDVFVADTDHDAVKEVLTNGAVQTLGSGFSGPEGVALDAAGDVFVADDGNSVVKEILLGGTINIIGSRFDTPTGVAVDASGDVFVTDYGNRRAVELSPPTVAATASPLSGSTATPVSGTVAGLIPGTTYYYRAVVSSAGGTVADTTTPPESFTTPIITWANPAGISYGTTLGPAQLDATASIGGVKLAGSFTYTLADGTSPAAGAVLHAGQNQVLNVTFTPTDTTHYATDTAQVEINVDPVPLTIIADHTTKVYGAALPTLTASYSGFVNGDTAASLATPPTLATTATVGSHVSGSPYKITTSGAVDPDYTISYVAGRLTVTPATLVIAADDKSKVYGAALPTLTASYFGFVNGDDAARLTIPPALSTTGTAASHVSGSPYSITASGAADADYTVTYVPGSLTVTPAPLTITADNKSKVYGAALPALSASYSGFVNGDGAAKLTTQPSLSTTATAGSHVADSPYTITASGAADADYTISYATGALTVTPAPLTITADDKSKSFGAPLPTLTASYAGFVNGDSAASLTPPPTLATTATPSSRVSGSPYAITGSGAADADYTISYVRGKLTVVAAPFDASGVSVAAAEGATFSTTTATFNDTGNGPYLATIDWGDNTPLATVTPTPIAGGGFGVSGNHVYAEEGSYTLSVIIRDAAGASVTVHPLASVADAPLSGATATIAAGATVAGTVASFIDADTGDAAGDYAASIDWGDGQTSAGTIVAGTSAGAFNVAGNHNYTDNNPHTVTVAVTHGTEQPLVVKSVEPGQTVNLLGNFGVAEDIYVVGPGTVTVAAANGLLANDSASGPLTVTSGTVVGANGGTFVFHIDGSFTYTPSANFPGFDHAQYTATDAAGDHASATVNVLSQTGGVVWKFYESVLGRDPDYAGLQHWITDFANGGKTGDIAVGFFESDELLDKIIGGYYEQYLQRAADSGGLTHWKAVWDQNGGPEQIRVFFAESNEFYASSGGTPDAWINALYQRILGRAPDAHGEQFWLSYYQQQLAAGVEPEAARYYIASFFLTSKEDFADDAIGWFNEYLLRAPTDGELQQYTEEMLAGASDRQIEQEITNLPEYGQNPPASPVGTAQRLPDYFQSGSRPSSQQATVAAKDAVFSQLGD